MRTLGYWAGAAICLMATWCPSSAFGEKSEWVIYGPGARLSPHDRYLAFFAGPRPSVPKGREIPPPQYSRMYILDFDANDVICWKHFTPYFYALAWKPTGPASVSVVEDLFDPRGVFRTRLLQLPPAKNPVATLSQEYDADTDSIYSIAAMDWSPDGAVLAAGGLCSYLHLSCDGGSSFVNTGKSYGALRLQWGDSYTLLAERARDDNATEVVSIRVKNRAIQSVRTLSGGTAARLCDTLEGRAVWRTRHAVYIGETKFLDSEHCVRSVRADGEYVVVNLWPAHGDGQIVVCDRQRKVVSQWAVRRTVTLMDISSSRGCVYVGERSPCQVRGHDFRQGGNVSATWLVPRADSPEWTEQG